MRDRFRGLAAAGRPARISVAHDLEREPHDIVGHRRREEQRLADGRHRRDDAADVGPEAHVHHAVGFVEHEQLDAAEVGVLLAHVIDQPARRGDDDVDAGAQGALLHAHLDAAVDGGARDRRVIRQAVNLVFDLHGELARRREDEHAALRGRRFRRRRSAPSGWRRRQQPLQHRDDERGGLAGAGFGARDEVVAGERERNDRALNRPRVAEAEIADAFEQPRIEAERRERDRRRVARRRFERGRLARSMDATAGFSARARRPGRRTR